jgi:primosomal protein N' (replication factor Y)
VERAACGCADELREETERAGVTLLGPAPQALARLRGRHRWHLLLKGGSARAVREAAGRGLTWAESRKRPGQVRVQADVDPSEVM